MRSHCQLDIELPGREKRDATTKCAETELKNEERRGNATTKDTKSTKEERRNEE